MEGIIIKDDARYEYLEKYLIKKNYIFHEPDISPENLDFIIFPFKENVDTSLYGEDYFSSLCRNAQVFSGIRSGYIERLCAANKLEYHVMMEDSGVSAKNAVPTSEGVISHLISSRTTTIFNSRILVMGYGLCGRNLAKKLKALEAEVYALVRNKEKERAALDDAVTPVYLSEIKETRFDVIINTVPGTVLSNDELEQLKGALMIDIASKPYGFDMDYAKKLNKNSTLLPGIPGKYAIRSAGEILGEYVYEKRG